MIMSSKMKQLDTSDLIRVDYDIFKDGIKISDEMAEAIRVADMPIEECRDYREEMAKFKEKRFGHLQD